MNDKERILTNIIQELCFTMRLAPNPGGYRKEDFTRIGESDRVYVHFAGYRNPQPGDLVICQTMNVNDWKIGIYEQHLASNEAIIREIGTDRRCRVSNEQFVAIDGMSAEKMLERDEYAFYVKVLKAFRRGGEYCYRFGGIDFDGRDATIWVREAFGGLRNSKPFPVAMHWSKGTTIKAILETITEGGYGSRKFERTEEEM